MFRGSQMKEAWYKPYEENIIKKGKGENGRVNRVQLPGNTSCSQNLHIALDFAFKNQKTDTHAILFVISTQNYLGPLGIRMNNEAYTSFPREREILLMEGLKLYVLAFERDVKIENPHATFATLNGKTVHIVHLFIYDG